MRFRDRCILSIVVVVHKKYIVCALCAVHTHWASESDAELPTVLCPDLIEPDYCQKQVTNACDSARGRGAPWSGSDRDGSPPRRPRCGQRRTWAVGPPSQPGAAAHGTAPLP